MREMLAVTAALAGRGARRLGGAAHRRPLLRRHPRLHGRPRGARGAARRADRRRPRRRHDHLRRRERASSTWSSADEEIAERVAAYEPPAPKYDDGGARQVRPPRGLGGRGRADELSSAVLGRVAPACTRARPRHLVARNSSAVVEASAGRSTIGTWPVSSKIELAGTRDQLDERVGVAHRDDHVLLAPDDQRGAADLRQPLAEVVVQAGTQRVSKPGLSAPFIRPSNIMSGLIRLGWRQTRLIAQWRELGRAARSSSSGATLLVASRPAALPAASTGPLGHVHLRHPGRGQQHQPLDACPGGGSPPRRPRSRPSSCPPARRARARAARTARPRRAP